MIKTIVRNILRHEFDEESKIYSRDIKVQLGVVENDDDFKGLGDLYDRFEDTESTLVSFLFILC